MNLKLHLPTNIVMSQRILPSRVGYCIQHLRETYWLPDLCLNFQKKMQTINISSLYYRREDSYVYTIRISYTRNETNWTLTPKVGE